MYEVIFYQDLKDKCLVDDFLDGMQPKIRAKALKWLSKLEEEGPNLPRPFADVVQGKIRELRIRFGSNQYRFLYFIKGKHIVVTHGFMKKTDKVPPVEIARSNRLMKEFLDRC